jgi:dTDP-4-dehydrorhamnose 3,5-epimerase
MKKENKIEGVIIQNLKIISDNRGSVLHMLRNDSSLFKVFGEIYFSEINPKTIKAWKFHKSLTQNIAVLMGKVRLVLYDNRPSSKTLGKIVEHEIGRDNNYCLVQIPPMLWYGFQSLDNQKALIANCTDQPHNPLESESIPIDSDKIPFQWDSKK